MELTRTGKLVVPVFGSKGYLEGDELVRGWLDSQIDGALEHPRYLPVVKAMESEKKLAEMLKCFNVDADGSPIIGDWMLYRCSINAAKLAGTWYKYKVSKEKWMSSVRFSPIHVSLNNGNAIKEPDGVEVFPTKGKFFTAYQFIKAGATFTFTITVADDLILTPNSYKDEETGKQITEYIPDFDKIAECVDAVLEKMQIVGIGAFRERFGKFIYVE